MDSEISALKLAFSSNNDWFEYSTVVVLAGLVFELVVLFALHKTASWREKSVLIAGTLIIAIGVAGEWHFGSKATAAALRLQAIADEKVAMLASETASANEAAGKANERAAELKLALEKEIAARQPRRITAAQREQIVEALKLEPKGPISVTWKLFDEEAVQFGKDVLETLRAAGYDPKEERGAFSFGIPGQWLLVADQSWLGKPTYAGGIQAALKKMSRAARSRSPHGAPALLGLGVESNTGQTTLPQICCALHSEMQCGDKMQDLEKMAAKLLETARKLPPGAT